MLNLGFNPYCNGCTSRRQRLSMVRQNVVSILIVMDVLLEGFEAEVKVSNQGKFQSLL